MFKLHGNHREPTKYDIFVVEVTSCSGTATFWDGVSRCAYTGHCPSYRQSQVPRASYVPLYGSHYPFFAGSSIKSIPIGLSCSRRALSEGSKQRTSRSYLKKIRPQRRYCINTCSRYGLCTFQIGVHIGHARLLLQKLFLNATKKVPVHQGSLQGLPG